MFKRIKSACTPKSLITLFTIIVVLKSFYFLFIHAMVIKNRSYDPGQPGYQFLNFQEELKGVEKIGYVTDKKITSENNDGFYLMAQYFLSPTIIELGNSTHEYTIIDSLDPTYIVKTLLALNVQRITNNEYGQALFQRIDK